MATVGHGIALLDGVAAADEKEPAAGRVLLTVLESIVYGIGS
jgi:hypothetical protein